MGGMGHNKEKTRCFRLGKMNEASSVEDHFCWVCMVSGLTSQNLSSLEGCRQGTPGHRDLGLAKATS